MKSFYKKHYKKIIWCSLIFVALVSVINAKNDSLIYDEAAHIPAGYSYLKKFDMRLNPEHPPLIKDLSALPLMFMSLNFDTTQDFWDQNPNDAQWNAGKYFLFNAQNNPDKIIFWSRLPIILLSLILGLFIFKWANELAGLGAGLLALTLYAFDPNILGHNHFVTTDLGIAAFITFAFYYFLKFLKYPSWKNTFTIGLFLALVQLAKFSSMLIFPVFILILIFYPLVAISKKKQLNERISKLSIFGEYWIKFFIAVTTSLILVWFVYFLTTFNMPADKLPEIVNYYFNVDNQQNAVVKQAIFFLNDHPFSRPLAVYIFGIIRVFQRVAGGNVAYFFGEVATQGFLSYFPVVFLIKEPLPTLLFIFSALLITIFGAKRIKNHLSWEKLSSFLRNRVTEIALCIFVILYLFSSITGRLNIGIRHLFPIFPFLYILTATAIFGFINHLNNKLWEKIAHTAVLILSLTLVILTVHAYPNYTSYFNESVGGSKNGYHYVTDSNADWGQDLKRLKIFLESHPEIENLKVDYFGLADLRYYLGDSYISWWKEKRPVEPGWYAISTLFLQEGIYDHRIPNEKSYRWLENKKPLYQVGTSILIYKVGTKEAATIN